MFLWPVERHELEMEVMFGCRVCVVCSHRADTDTGHKAGLMPGVTPRLTGHNARNAPGILVPECIAAIPWTKVHDIQRNDLPGEEEDTGKAQSR